MIYETTPHLRARPLPRSAVVRPSYEEMASDLERLQTAAQAWLDSFSVNGGTWLPEARVVRALLILQRRG